MPERNVIGGMDRVGIMVLEDAFDAKPTFAGFPRRCWALRPARRSLHAGDVVHLRKEMADRPIVG